ncbi:MAG TPA: hypothetical protein VN694_02685 [Caulobacteraceae bacterium]|nr:hypothetical protein [Caulobacteraceae bacterium]
MQRQVGQRDLAALERGDRRAGRQPCAHRIVEPQLAAAHRVAEQQRRQRLGDRADLEQRVRARRPALGGRAVSEPPSPLGRDDPHRDARAAPLLVHPALEDRADLAVRPHAATLDAPAAPVP